MRGAGEGLPLFVCALVSRCRALSRWGKIRHHALLGSASRPPRLQLLHLSFFRDPHSVAELFLRCRCKGKDAFSSPWVTKTFGFPRNAPSHSRRPFWSACAEKPPIVLIFALTATSSPLMITVFTPSTIRLPRVPKAWNPTKMILHSGRQRLCFKWCLILPASHMPLPAMMIAPDLMSFKALDSSTDWVNLSR